ncbi:hypothetical protein BDD12DRAFT_846131 [Trichophaea hybrida]|nr:hypothetical protein BDD12DRAFT_846131 [Trichophaea hybrida]
MINITTRKTRFQNTPQFSSRHLQPCHFQSNIGPVCVFAFDQFGILFMGPNCSSYRTLFCVCYECAEREPALIREVRLRCGKSLVLSPPTPVAIRLCLDLSNTKSQRTSAKIAYTSLMFVDFSYRGRRSGDLSMVPPCSHRGSPVLRTPHTVGFQP